MSQIRLLKDHKGHKAGAVIQTPWMEGKNLIAQGIGQYHDAKPPEKPAAPVAVAPAPLSVVPAAPPAEPKSKKS